MNVLELKALLGKKDYDSGVVSYNDGEKLGGFNIKETDGIWNFYLIDDKGNVINKKSFSKEDDLCTYVINFVNSEHEKMAASIKKYKENEKSLEIPSIIFL